MMITMVMIVLVLGVECCYLPLTVIVSVHLVFRFLTIILIGPVEIDALVTYLLKIPKLSGQAHGCHEATANSYA